MALLLAVEMFDGDMGPHGQPMSEATSPEADPNFKGGWRYEAVGPNVDWAAKALEDRKEKFYDGHDDWNRNGHMWSVRKVES